MSRKLRPVVLVLALLVPIWLVADERPRILVVNDDGIASPGIQALAQALSQLGEVTVIAPEKNQSGISMAVTFEADVALRPVDKGDGLRYFAIDLKPADCVTVGLDRMREAPPDLVVSGINRGANLGALNALLSGTVGAARMAALHGIPAMAVSMGSYRQETFHWETAAEIARRVTAQLLERGLPTGVVLNLNVPNVTLAELRGLRAARLGGREYEWRYTELGPAEGGATRIEPDTQDLPVEGTLDEDLIAFGAGYATLTPLVTDTTAYDLLREVSSWPFE
jgi:5'-nucleotidase